MSIRRLTEIRPNTTALVFLGYLALAVAITWPWALHPGSLLYGVIGGDLTSSVGFYGVAADELQPPFLPGVLHDFNAPAGIETQWALNLAGAGSSSALFVLSVLFGSVAAHGIMAVSGYALTAFAMFLLLRRLGASDPVATVVGLGFGFWPYTYGSGWTWPHYIHGWVFVLMVWRMLELAERPSLRNGLWAGAAAIVAMTWIQYNLLLGGVLLALLSVLVVLRAFLYRRGREAVVALAATFAMTVTAMMIVVGAGTVSGYEGLPSRDASDVVQRSARPLMYLVPSPRNVIVGDQTGPFLERRFSGLNGQAAYADIYIGLSLIVLATGGVAWAAAMLLRQRRRAIEDTLVQGAILGAALVVTGVLFSAPPQVDVVGLTIPMPYKPINEVTPVFRVAHRFAIFVALGAGILAACGLTAMLKSRSTALRAAVSVAVGMILFFDLYSPVAERTRVSPPRWAETLADMPPGTLAEYPIQFEENALNEGALWQVTHHKRLFAGFRNNSEWAARKLDLAVLRQPGTVAQLARLGVDYVVVHHPPTGSFTPADPRPDEAIPGLRLIDPNRDASIYKVMASPSHTAVRSLTGFDLPQGNRIVRRSQGLNPARLEVVADCNTCSGVVRFRASAHVVPRIVSIAQDGYGVVFRQRISRRRVITVRIQPFARRTVLRLVSDPAPDPLGIAISEPTFRFEQASR